LRTWAESPLRRTRSTGTPMHLPLVVTDARPGRSASLPDVPRLPRFRLPAGTGLSTPPTVFFVATGNRPLVPTVSEDSLPRTPFSTWTTEAFRNTGQDTWAVRSLNVSLVEGFPNSLETRLLLTITYDALQDRSCFVSCLAGRLCHVLVRCCSAALHHLARLDQILILMLYAR
jgi:hypothetical protein